MLSSVSLILLKSVWTWSLQRRLDRPYELSLAVLLPILFLTLSFCLFYVHVLTKVVFWHLVIAKIYVSSHRSCNTKHYFLLMFQECKVALCSSMVLILEQFLNTYFIIVFLFLVFLKIISLATRILRNQWHIFCQSFYLFFRVTQVYNYSQI